jgi:hypothetical protein
MMPQIFSTLWRETPTVSVSQRKRRNIRRLNEVREEHPMKLPTLLSPLTLAITATLVMGPADAGPSIIAVTPIFGQVMAITYPSQFKMVNQETKGPYYLQESVKSGETVDQWSEMITLTGRQGAASLPQASAKSFVLNIFKDFQTACPATFSILELSPRNLDGRETFAAIGSCGAVSTAEEASKHAAHSETALIVGIKGNADIYTIQWAQRGQPSTRPLVLEPGVWADRFKQLEPIHVCERGPNEIQSCAARK